MKRPAYLKPFVTPAQWRKLAIHQLDREDRQHILELLKIGFEGADPKELGGNGIAAILKYIQEDADDFAVVGLYKNEEYTKEDVNLGMATAREILREDRAAAKKRRRKPR